MSAIAIALTVIIVAEGIFVIAIVIGGGMRLGREPTLEEMGIGLDRSEAAYRDAIRSGDPEEIARQERAVQDRMNRLGGWDNWHEGPAVPDTQHLAPPPKGGVASNLRPHKDEDDL